MKKSPRKRRPRRAIQNATLRKLGLAWERVQHAYFAGTIVAGEVYRTAEIRRLCNIPTAGIAGCQMDLAAHRAACRLVDHGPGKLLVRAA